MLVDGMHTYMYIYVNLYVFSLSSGLAVSELSFRDSRSFNSKLGSRFHPTIPGKTRSRRYGLLAVVAWKLDVVALLLSYSTYSLTRISCTPRPVSISPQNTP